MNIDTTVELAAVDRRVEGSVLRLSRWYAEALDEVWSALTRPERIARWLAPVTGDLVLGGRYRVEGNADPDWLRAAGDRCLAAYTGEPEG